MAVRIRRVPKSLKRWEEFQGWCNARTPDRWAFRGEPVCKTSLRPTAGRIVPYQPERELLLYQQFERRVRQFRSEAAAFPAIETLALAQHHGLPTRLLDWTTSPYAAAYFAVSSRNPKASVKVYAVDRTHVPSTPSDLYSCEKIIDLLAIDATVIVETPTLTPRIGAQRGLFSYHARPPLRMKAPKNPDFLKNAIVFEIAATDRAFFRSRLYQMGIDALQLMTDLDGLCASLGWWYHSGLRPPAITGASIVKGGS